MKSSLITRPIFIVGAGRSGTTLLRSLLSAHSRIAVTPETHFMKWTASQENLESGAPRDFEAYWGRYTSWIRFKDLGVDAHRCRELIEQQGNRTFRSVFRAVLTAYGEKIGKERIGEKTPGHVHFLSRLLEWFPEARVLVVQRDPRAVVASQLRTPWVGMRQTPVSLRKGMFIGKCLYEVAFYADDWATIYEKVVPAWRDDPRIFRVSYETLVNDVENELRTICEFLGEQYEPKMLNGRRDDTVPIPAGTAEIKNERWRRWQAEHHAQTLQPVSAGSLEKWKGQLTETAVAMIEGRCSKGMVAMGYEPSIAPSRRVSGWLLSSTLFTIGNVETRARALVKRTLGPLPSFGRNARMDG